MQPEPMKQAEEQMRELDARIVEALERAPRVIVPEGFAARVAARVPAQRVCVYRRTRIKASRYGMGAAAAGLIVLEFVILRLAPGVQDNGAFWQAWEETFS